MTSVGVWHTLRLRTQQGHVLPGVLLKGPSGLGRGLGGGARPRPGPRASVFVLQGDAHRRGHNTSRGRLRGGRLLGSLKLSLGSENKRKRLF